MVVTGYYSCLLKLYIRIILPPNNLYVNQNQEKLPDMQPKWEFDFSSDEFAEFILIAYEHFLCNLYAQINTRFL